MNEQRTNVVREAMPRAISEGNKFISDSQGLFKNDDLPAFIAGFLAHVVIQYKEEQA